MIKKLSVGNWEVSVSSWSERFPPSLVAQALEFINSWTQVFPREEETWVQKTYGIPSLVIRLDCVEKEGSLQVYEVEERPAGIGITSQINPEFWKRFCIIRKEWPPIAVVVSPQRKGTGDDFLWAPVRTLEDIKDLSLEVRLLIRAEPWEKEFWPFAARSISTVRYEGRKDYGEKLGLWKRVSSEEELPWEEGFCLKPIQGSKCQDIEIFSADRKHRGSTKTQILRKLKEKGVMYLQPLIPPMKWEDEVPEEVRQYYWRIWRIFFGFNPSQGWVPLGGLWNARLSWKLHGASNTLFGQLVI